VLARSAAVAAVLLLASCGNTPTVRQATAACHLDALKTYSHVENFESRRDQIADFMDVCMKAKGFYYSIFANPKLCNRGEYDISVKYAQRTNDACYVTD
jgi:hypothetical protein